MNYPGYRVMLGSVFGALKGDIQIDIGIGDVVYPKNYSLQLSKHIGKPMFEGEISLLVYPPEAIFAEKLETVIFRAASNSRMKDYHDLILLSREKSLIDQEILKDTISGTFRNRGTSFKPIGFDTREIEMLQKLWKRHLNDLKDIADDLNLPEDIAFVIEEVNEYVASFVR